MSPRTSVIVRQSIRSHCPPHSSIWSPYRASHLLISSPHFQNPSPLAQCRPRLSSGSLRAHRHHQQQSLDLHRRRRHHHDGYTKYMVREVGMVGDVSQQVQRGGVVLRMIRMGKRHLRSLLLGAFTHGIVLQAARKTETASGLENEGEKG